MRRIFAILAMLSVIVTTQVKALTLTSSAAAQQGALPAIYTCDDKDISPALTWSNAPSKTESFALILSDPDAPSGTFYHWVLYNLPKHTSELPQAIEKLPAGTQIGKNSWGSMQYRGPCPPSGAKHHYIFTLYALDIPLKLATGADAIAVINAVQEHILELATYTVIYSH